MRACAVLLLGAALVACKRDTRPMQQQTTQPPAIASASVVEPPAPSVSVSALPVAPPIARAFSLTLPSGNANSFGKPNLWAYVPAAYRADRPLHLVFVFHGFQSCLDSFVGDAGVPCKPSDQPRLAIDLPSQIDKAGTGAVVLVPQLAYDEKLGDPGVLDSGPALEKLTREALEGPLADALGPRKLDDVEHVAMMAISGGYQALYAVLGPEGKGAFGERLRDVFLLDAYYAEEGAVDAWLWKNLAEFAVDSGRPRHLGVVYSTIELPRQYSQAFAARAAVALQKEGLSSSLLHRDTPRETTVEELATPVSFLFSSREHDDIPRADVAKILSAIGI